jgi:hypothetical protein
MDEFTYDDWAELLEEFFFGDAHAGEEILFAVDELALCEASGLDEVAAGASLASAVRSVIGRAWNVAAVKERVTQWRATGAAGPHPALPFLALTVLAAYRMGAYEGFASHKFYVPLRRTLADDDEGTDAPGTYLDYVTELWHDLSRWSNEEREGLGGRLTIRDPGVHYGRGLAFQHALVKSYDLTQLDSFFRRIGLQPGEDVAPAELRRALAVWTGGRGEPWARRLQRVASDPELSQYAEALLAREAAKWDGRPRDPRTGRAIGRIRLGFSSVRRPRLGVYLQWDDRFPEVAILQMPDGSAVELHRSNGWFAPHPFESLDAAAVMKEGAELGGRSLRFDLRADDVYAFGYDDDLGSWVSTDSVSYGDRYHLVVRSDCASACVAFAQASSSARSMIDEQASRSLPPGWKLIVNVQIDARPKVAPPAPLASLIPVGSSPRLRLLGGLPLSTGHGVFLRGGEPALALSSLSDEDTITVTRSSTRHTERFKVEAGPSREVPLWLLRLDPDTYEIRHGESKVTLKIVDGIAEAAGPGAGTIKLGARGTTVVGTTTDAPRTDWDPLTIPAPARGERVVLLGSRPGYHHIVECPTWTASLAGHDLSWRRIDAWPEFPPVWLLMRGSSGRYEASLLSRREPDIESASSDTQWGRLIALARLFDSASAEDAALWDRYRRAAGVAT